MTVCMMLYLHIILPGKRKGLSQEADERAGKGEVVASKLPIYGCGAHEMTYVVKSIISLPVFAVESKTGGRLDESCFFHLRLSGYLSR